MSSPRFGACGRDGMRPVPGCSARQDGTDLDRLEDIYIRVRSSTTINLCYCTGHRWADICLAQASHGGVR